MIRELLARIWNQFPYDLTKRVDILRRNSIWRNHNVLFIHIPKAAGVSVNKAIYGKPLGHFYASDIKKICPKTFKDAYTFSLVRNPYTRLYSAYNFARKGGTEVMKIHKSNYYINNPDFKTFESFLTKWLLNSDLSKIDHVFRPQHLYLFDHNYNLLVDNFYKLEEIMLVSTEIASKIGKPFTLEIHNQTPNNSFNVSADLKKIIYDLYKKDFELLGYQE